MDASANIVHHTLMHGWLVTPTSIIHCKVMTSYSVIVMTMRWLHLLAKDVIRAVQYGMDMSGHSQIMPAAPPIQSSLIGHCLSFPPHEGIYGAAHIVYSCSVRMLKVSLINSPSNCQ